MKKTMPDFLTALSDNDYEVFEELFTKKYRKFVKLFKLINKYADYITNLKYKKSSDDELKISMTVAKIDTDQIISEMEESVPDDDEILIWNEKKVIHIEIKLDESEMP